MTRAVTIFAFALILLSGVLAQAAPPNIVFILADDLGQRDLGCYGSTFYETPHLDRLAKDGMRFTDGYAACQVCSPTRASIMTGKYPARLHLTNFLKGVLQPQDAPILTAKYRDALPLEEMTVAELLQAAGYATGHFGKWHLGGEPHGPAKQGFTAGRQFEQKDPQGKPDKNTARLTDQAIEFISSNREKPFFCYLPYHTVHIPLEADARLIDKYRQKAKLAKGPQTNPIYAAMIEEMDQHVGRLLAKLDELGLANNTLVVFMSDNGGLSVVEGPHTPATSNAPLRESKGFMYEGGIRVPWIVRWPAKIRRESTCEVPVCSIDWLPTLLSACGVQGLPPDIDGVSLLPLLEGKGSLPARDLFWHYPHFANQGGRPAAAIRSGDWKLIEFYETGKLELYDLKNDIGEQHDLAESRPEIVKELHGKLVAWRKRVNANMPEPRR